VPKSSPIITAFNAGEWSPKLEGRDQQEKYQSACRVLENFIPQIHGNAEKRTGTRFVAEVKNSANATRLIPFEFSTLQAYVLEFGDQYMRVYKDSGVVESSPSVAYEISTPYASGDLSGLQFAQSADVLYLAHREYAPRKLSRTGDTSWTLTEIEFDWPAFLPDNADESVTVYASASTGTFNLVASSAIFTADMVDGYFKFSENIFSQHDLWEPGATILGGETRRFGNNVYSSAAGGTAGTRPPIHTVGTETDGSITDWEYLHSGSTYVKITAYTSGTQVSAQGVGALLPASVIGSGNATYRWAIGAWSAENGFPSSVTFYEDRLLWAGTTNNPQTIWGSKSGDYENHQSGTNDDDAYQYTINTDQVNAIQWLSPEKVLLIGTLGGEFAMRASSLDEAITPTNVRVSEETQFGSKALRAMRVGNATLFIQRAGRKLREMKYDFDSDSYQAKDITLLSEHITSPSVAEMAYQGQPSQILWCVRSDGVLLGFTYERTEQVFCWHRHVLGGTNAKVKSVAAIPHPDGDQDQLWLIVERTIDGSTVQYVEHLEKVWDTANDIEDAFFVDSGLTYDGSAVTSLSGLDHLEGETVTVLADGASHASKVVSSGAINLDRSASVVHVGLGYDATLQTMRIEAGAADGTAQGKTKRLTNCTVRLYQTGPGLWYGANTTEMDEINFRETSMAMGVAVPLFDGDKGPLPWPEGYEQDARVTLQHRLPLPCSILAIMPQLVTQDR